MFKLWQKLEALQDLIGSYLVAPELSLLQCLWLVIDLGLTFKPISDIRVID